LLSAKAPFPSDHVLSEWSSYLIEAGERNGKTLTIAKNAKTLINNAGFTNVVEEIYPVRLSHSLQESDQWNYIQFTEGMEGFALRPLIEHLGVSTKTLINIYCD
jgi:hypothetical protein